MVTIAVGSDHAGYLLKERLAGELRDLGHDVLNLGSHSTDRVDYPDFGSAVGRAVVDGVAELGVCVCGSGIGIAMAANKVPGVRAATVHDATSARLARQHNDANVICLGERLTGPEVASLQDKASHLRQRLLAVFPQLENTKLSRVWTGKCAGTFDLWPHLGEHDGIHFAMGYCFAGLPMGTHLGRKAAETIIDGRPSSSVFRDRPFKSHPLYFGNPWFLPWFMKWYDYQDRKAAAA